MCFSTVVCSLVQVWDLGLLSSLWKKMVLKDWMSRYPRGPCWASIHRNSHISALFSGDGCWCWQDSPHLGKWRVFEWQYITNGGGQSVCFQCKLKSHNCLWQKTWLSFLQTHRWELITACPSIFLSLSCFGCSAGSEEMRAWDCFAADSLPPPSNALSTKINEDFVFYFSHF